jgi:cytochrome bd-type quinol oxidase subunit 2
VDNLKGRKHSMTKKQKVLTYLIAIPVILIQVYNFYFQYASNWLEDYQNYFKLTFLTISIIGSIWLIMISKKDKTNIWLALSVILLVLLLLYLYIAITIIKTSY